jgi:DNA-binding PucR family transcriptional regulator
MNASESIRRTLRGLELFSSATGVIDTEEHLVDLVVNADAEALADLRAKVLAPMDSLRPAVKEKLTETLRAWVLHHGRRDEIAAALYIHPQTVRYRLGQLRELYGDDLQKPGVIKELTVALA